MYLLDSNILIYSSKTEYSFLRNYITSTTAISAVSVATVIEVLGYHKLSFEDKTYFESCIALLQVFEVSQSISDKAVELRQNQKMSLGDAIIAATAIVHDCELVTRNVGDFAGITALKLLNPFP
ncbi:MAG: type II toxin-antitoxin system VapC family toxin [Bacteroidia bacterium]